jgi:hypothetical protein
MDMSIAARLWWDMVSDTKMAIAKEEELDVMDA